VKIGGRGGIDGAFFDCHQYVGFSSVNLDWGQVIVDLSMKTDVAGLFVAGDMRIQAPKQVVSAAGDGSIAALQVIAYIQELA